MQWSLGVVNNLAIVSRFVLNTSHRNNTRSAIIKQKIENFKNGGGGVTFLLKKLNLYDSCS